MMPYIRSITFRGQKIYEITSEQARLHILNTPDQIHFPNPGLYLIYEADRYVAIDNSTGNAFIEEFERLNDAKRWLVEYA